MLPNHLSNVQGEPQSPAWPTKRSRHEPPRDNTVDEKDIGVVELNSDDSDSEDSSDEEVEMITDNITQWSGTTSVIHEIPLFIVDDNT